MDTGVRTQKPTFAYRWSSGLINTSRLARVYLYTTSKVEQYSHDRKCGAKSRGICTTSIPCGRDETDCRHKLRQPPLHQGHCIYLFEWLINSQVDLNCRFAVRTETPITASQSPPQYVWSEELPRRVMDREGGEKIWFTVWKAANLA